MEELQKTIKEYNAWKDKITKVLDDNFQTIVDIVSGAYGADNFFSIKVDYSSQPQIIGNSQPVVMQIIREGIVVNKNPQNSDSYLWYYKDSCFYLIERSGANQFLNITPISHKSLLPFYTCTQRANSENEVDFIISFMNWADSFIKELKKRMKSVQPNDVKNKIKEMEKLSI